jgi:hypothetical protein
LCSRRYLLSESSKAKTRRVVNVCIPTQKLSAAIDIMIRCKDSNIVAYAPRHLF